MLVNKYWKEDDSLKKPTKMQSLKDVTSPTESIMSSIEVGTSKAKLESVNIAQRKSLQPNITFSDMHSAAINEGKQKL
jgi:hypothetical protein